MPIVVGCSNFDDVGYSCGPSDSRYPNTMAVELFNNGKHACLAFYDLVDEEADHAVQCNQFLIVDGDHGALIDPGGK